MQLDLIFLILILGLDIFYQATNKTINNYFYIYIYTFDGIYLKKKDNFNAKVIKSKKI